MTVSSGDQGYRRRSGPGRPASKGLKAPRGDCEILTEAGMIVDPALSAQLQIDFVPPSQATGRGGGLGDAELGDAALIGPDIPARNNLAMRAQRNFGLSRIHVPHLARDIVAATRPDGRCHVFAAIWEGLEKKFQEREPSFDLVARTSRLVTKLPAVRGGRRRFRQTRVGWRSNRTRQGRGGRLKRRPDQPRRRAIPGP